MHRTTSYTNLCSINTKHACIEKSHASTTGHNETQNELEKEDPTSSSKPPKPSKHYNYIQQHLSTEIRHMHLDLSTSNALPKVFCRCCTTILYCIL